MKTNRYFIVALLAFVNFSHILDFMIMMPMSDMLTKNLHISSQAFSQLVSAYGFAAIVSGILSIKIFDRYDRKYLLLIVFSLFLISTFGCAMVNSFVGLFFMRLSAGFFGGIIGAILIAMVADLFEYKNRGKAMGLVMLGFSSASVLGVPMGLWLAGKNNWQYPFIMIALVGTCLLFILFIFLPTFNTHLKNSDNKKSFKQIFNSTFKQPNHRNAILLSFTLMFGHFIIIPFLALYLVRNVGFPDDQLMFIYLIGGAITIVSGPLAGKITDRYGAKKIFVTALILAVFPVIIITNLPPVSYFTVLICTSSFFLFANSRMIPGTTLISSVVTPQERGSFESIRSSANQLAGAFAAIVGGLIVNDKGAKVENYSIAGLVSVCVCLFCLYFVNKIKPIHQKSNG